MFCSPCPTLPRKGHRRALTLPRTHSCECAWGQGDGLDTTSGGPSHGEATQFKCLDLEVSGEPPGLAWLRPRAGTDGRFLMSPRGQSQSQRVWFPAVFLPPSPFFFLFFLFFHTACGVLVALLGILPRPLQQKHRDLDGLTTGPPVVCF